MPPDFADYTADLWTPSELVEDTGVVDTSAFRLAQAAVPCDAIQMTSKDKIMSGLDPSDKLYYLFVAGFNLTVDDIPAKSIFYVRDLGEYYRVAFPPDHFVRVSDQWDFIAEQETTPPAELLRHYAS